METTTRTFKMPRAAVRALLHLAASKEIRHYLKGILCEVSSRRTVMVATNGHVLGVYRHDCQESEPNSCGAPFSIIIPRDALDAIGKAKTSTRYVTVRGSQDGRFEVVDGSTMHTFAPIEGKFPDWRRVMPRNAPTMGADDLPFAQFDPAYVQAFSKVARELGCKAAGSLRIGHRGSRDSACVEIGSEPFFGVLMPLRVDRDEIPTRAPAWCHEPMPAAEPVTTIENADDAGANDSDRGMQAAA